MRKVLGGVAVLCLLGLTTSTTFAQSLLPASALIRSVAVRLFIFNVGSDHPQLGLCHGFVYATSQQFAYVVTNKHCIEESTAGSLEAVSLAGLTVQIWFANGTTGWAQRMVWSKTEDALVLLSSYGARPSSFVSTCPLCKPYATFGSSANVPVVSLLSAGQGPAVLSSGRVISDATGKYRLNLVVFLGTSGAPVFDLNGNLVGIVFRVRIGKDQEYETEVVFGSAVVYCLRQSERNGG